MINHKHILTFLILLTIFSCSSDPDKDEIKNPDPSFLGELSFTKTFGGTRNEVGNSIIATNDSGYIILGYVDSIDGDIINKTANDSDYLILKYDANDNLQWQKSYGGSKDDRGNSIIQTNDSGFALIGFSKSDDGDVGINEGNSDFWFLKLNPSGDISWKKTFGFSGNDFGTSVIQTSDNGYLIIGELDVTSSGGLGNSRFLNRHAGGDFWVIKLNASGDTEWTKFFGGTFTDTALDVVQTDDNSFIILGTSDSTDTDITDPKGDYDFWIIKISNTGNLIWEKNFGGSQIDKAAKLVKTNDGNFLCVGNTRSSDKNITNNNGGGDLWVVKISTNGNLIWEKTYGGTNFDAGTSIYPSKKGDFILVGNSRSTDNQFTNNGQNDAWILKISSNGNTIWQNFIGGSNIDLLHDVIELDNGNIVAVGESNSNDKDISENKGFSDLLIVKIK
ncbi:hypothetical protein ACSIGC_09115 [Tenacibaculum sp. ZS6-P6]|uniref:hypothetical protein n=1 Tax=Tenacibaculum sp. ZS6-P6 TaxID=3447503 RepID=UPI003F9E7378